MAVINSRTRYRATSEQQKKLQRNISLQAEAARLSIERADLHKKQETLNKLTALGVITTGQAMDSFIENTIASVERVLAAIG